MAKTIELRHRHPLIAHFLTKLRDRDTGSTEFRHHVRRLSLLLAYEATQDLVLDPFEVQTPVATFNGGRVSGRIGLVPILRSGLGMVDAMLDLLPDAEVRHLGFYRNEETLKPIEYYNKLPDNRPVDLALVVDPMLATGGSAVAAIEALRDWGVGRVKFIALIAAPEGIARLNEAFPECEVYVGAVDERLNEVGYIVPGLGDAGDRMFNTHTQ